MIEFKVKSRKLNIGNRKGQTVYYASPKSKQHLTNKMVVDRIVRETSLSAGAIVRDALLLGQSVDLADLGSFRVLVPSKMEDREVDVSVDSLNKPKIIFTPKAQMREAAKAVELRVDNEKRKKKP